MANNQFDPLKYVQSGFKVDNTPESIRATAEGILANEDFFGAAGNSRPVSSAKSALQQLQAYDEYIARGNPTDQKGTNLAEKALNRALSFITGSNQSGFQGFNQRLAGTQSDIRKKLANEASNLANLTTLPEGQRTPELNAQIAAKQAEIDKLTATARKLGVTDIPAIGQTASGDFIPQADIDRAQAMGAIPGGPAPIRTATTTVPAVMDATDFVLETPTAQVGAPKSAPGQEDLAQTVMSTEGGKIANNAFINATFKAFHGRDATAQELAQFANQSIEAVRDAVIAGSPFNKPATSTPEPGQMATLVGPDGERVQVEVGSQQAQQLFGQGYQLETTPPPEAGSAGTAETPQNTVKTGGDVNGGGGGPMTKLLASTQEILAPQLEQIKNAQKQLLSFQPTDLVDFKKQLEQESGLDMILNQLSNVDKNIAEVVDLSRKVPEDTLSRAEGTQITADVLNRQRSNELEKLSRTGADLSIIKQTLQEDLSRREDLIDQALILKKDAEDFKFKQLGNALDFMLQNFSISQDQAQQVFSAAVQDYELSLSFAEKQAEASKEAERSRQKQIEDYFNAFGLVYDPFSGQVVSVPKKEKTNSSSTINAKDVNEWISFISNGYGSINNVPQKLRPAVANAIEIGTQIQGPSLSGEPLSTKFNEAKKQAVKTTQSSDVNSLFDALISDL